MPKDENKNKKIVKKYKILINDKRIKKLFKYTQNIFKLFNTTCTSRIKKTFIDKKMVFHLLKINFLHVQKKNHKKIIM
jgi:hypothetical protein